MKLELTTLNIGKTRFQLVCASLKGFDKEKNQDSYKVYHDKNQIIIAVADGLGSAKYSERGSRFATELIVKLLKDNDSLDDLYLRVHKEWKKKFSINPENYDTTIKFIKIKNNKIVYGGVGDGRIAHFIDDKYFDLSSKGLFSNQTDTILSSNLKEKFIVNELNFSNNLSSLISTDGFSEDFDKENAKQFFIDINKEINHSVKNFAKDIKDTLKNWPIKTNGDDKTIVFIKKENEYE